jgi:hypothetical protein
VRKEEVMSMKVVRTVERMSQLLEVTMSNGSDVNDALCEGDF